MSSLIRSFFTLILTFALFTTGAMPMPAMAQQAVPGVVTVGMSGGMSAVTCEGSYVSLVPGVAMIDAPDSCRSIPGVFLVQNMTPNLCIALSFGGARMQTQRMGINGAQTVGMIVGNQFVNCLPPGSRAMIFGNPLGGALTGVAYASPMVSHNDAYPIDGIGVVNVINAAGPAPNGGLGVYPASRWAACSGMTIDPKRGVYGFDIFGGNCRQ